MQKNLDTVFTTFTSICSINFLASADITEVFSLLTQGLVAAAAIAKLSWDYIDRNQRNEK